MLWVETAVVKDRPTVRYAVGTGWEQGHIRFLCSSSRMATIPAFSFAPSIARAVVFAHRFDQTFKEEAQ